MQPFESVAVTVNANVPSAEGVPERTPPEERVVPVGNAPVARVYVYGAAPPLDVIVWL